MTVEVEQGTPRQQQRLAQAQGAMGAPIVTNDAVVAALCQASFKHFVQHAWHTIEPDQPLSWNWHIDVICQALQDLTLGKLNKNLLINVPPGAMKSLLVGVMWPAWTWTVRPPTRFFGAAYGEPLAIRDAVKARQIIDSHWYRKHWGTKVKLNAAQNEKRYYQNMQGGWRLATSVGGRGTGEHPDFKMVDDPHTAMGAQSDAERQSALDWYDATLTLRGATRQSKTVVVMQRLHQSDLSGHIIKSDGFAQNWLHICLPMEYEHGHPNRYEHDPRAAEGEGALLWPALYPKPTVARLAAVLGSYGAAGQFQQRPAPTGGGILKMSAHVQLWPRQADPPDLLFLMQSYDTAFTKDTKNDPTAQSVYGIFEHEGKRNVLIMDCWTEHLEYPELRQKVMDDYSLPYGGTEGDILHPPRRVDVVLIEKKASGQSLLQDLNRARVPVFAYDPLSSDKIQRAHEVAPLLETGCVWVLESRKEPTRPIKWVRPLIDQCEMFPAGDHDDLTDTFTQALIYLRDANWLELPKLAPPPVEDVDYYAERHRRQNPYNMRRT